jgi:hypothetical protein
MTDAKPPINPFHPPRWSPLRPLCPWQESEHRDYYVAVDSTEKAFEQYVQDMDDLTTLRRDGQLVLAVGESGCGKSALLNRCADWTVKQLGERGITCKVVDLTRSLGGREASEIDERMKIVCDRFFGDLKQLRLLKDDAEPRLEPDRDRPDRIYPSLPSALRDNTAVAVLLPKTELAVEVKRYAALAKEKVLLLMESTKFDADTVRSIRDELEGWVPPIVLSVGRLRPGDVRRFATDRLQRHVPLGSYPGMAEETMDSTERLVDSVAELQRALHGMYEQRRERGIDYDETFTVSYHDVLEYRIGMLQEMRGAGP